MSEDTARYAMVSSVNLEEIEAYLPRGYKVLGKSGDAAIIGGFDRAGWTLDGYVLPRLGSGRIHGVEISLNTCNSMGVAAYHKPEKYQVIVGNIGTVYSGADHQKAYDEYDDYCELSQLNYGRAAGESVTLMYEGEPREEYIGTQDND